LLSGRPGAAMIALKARAPLVPCYIHGAPYDGTTVGCLLMPASVRLVIGQPIDLSPYYDRDGEREVLEEVTQRAMREIARLGGRVDFQPQLAGRFYKPEEG
jgi:1-acyl-sn-glycerol-3-phosphate acyltransferase